MVEKTNDIKTTQVAEQDLPEHLRVKTDQVRTKGWWLFDTLVHGGVNGVGNIAASLLMAKDRANYNINKLVEDKENGTKRDNVFSHDLDVSKKDKRKTFLTNLPGFGGKRWNFYEFSAWLDSQFYNKDSAGNIKDTPSGTEFSSKKTALQKAGGVFGWLEDSKLGNVPVLNSLLKPLGKYTGGILFLSWGGHITNSVMWMLESPKIKPKLVRWLDEMSDATRRLIGKGPNAHELEARKEIYKKLDSELSGKSIKGVWGARFAGIGTVIGVASVAEALDAGITGRYVKEDGKLKLDENGNKIEKSQLGILRVSQGFFKGAKYHQAGMNSLGYDTNYKFLSDDKKSVDVARSQYFTDQTVTEVMGTGITTATQYAYLMMREFLGIGPKTNVGETSKQSQTNPTPKGRKQAKARIEDKAQTQTSNYVKRTPSRGKSYQDIARESQENQTMEHGV